jgi:uncharacterized RDD family membrane protein YckC
MEHLNIDTTQNVQIDYSPAGVGARVGAFLIDLMILIIYITASMGLINEMGFYDSWSIILISVIPVLCYHLLVEIFLEGQSLGKKAVEIKVIKTDGTPATMGSYLLRWVFRLIEIGATSGTVAFFAILINGKGQRLGDMAAGTTVVKIKQKTSLSDTLYTDIEEGYSPHYPEASRLTDNDISVIKEVLGKRNNYDRSTHQKLLLKTQDSIRRKMGSVEISEENSVEFLRTVIKDYNFIHG